MGGSLGLGRSRAVRWQPSRRAALAIGAVMVIAAAFALVKVFAARPQPLTVTSTPAGAVGDPVLSSGPARAVSGPPASPAAEVVIDIAGKVRRPGLYRLPAGARVDDALRAAGGVRPGVDTTALNLAAKLTDGQQILVGVAPSPGAVAAAGSGGAGAAGDAPSGLVSLNAATLEQLDDLPGVGPVLAQHIVDWRAEHGGFTDVAQLQDVTGIGPSKYADIKNLVTP